MRLYFHLAPAGAAPFVAAATRQLNAGRIPFRLKVLNDPSTFGRCDAGVLYLRSSNDWINLAADLHHATRSNVI